MALATIAAGTARLLIVTLERLGNIVVDNISHVGFVDTHTKSDRCHNHIHPLHKESILIVGARLRIHTRVVGQRLDSVGNE